MSKSQSVLPDGDFEVPDWMGCDLSVCRVLKDVSTQIAANCRTLGAQMQGACGKATAELPPPDPGGKASFDCADECFAFLQTFDALSGALLLLAGDLENGVTQPLQTTIMTLQEESFGRTKHWQQVRKRFTELQDRYCRSQKKSQEARKSLATSADSGSWFAGKSKSTVTSSRAATEQHAAMCELAQCEEELLRSEASLRSFEDESRERLAQLQREKSQRVAEALSKGAGSLRRLLPVVAEKDDNSQQEWKGIVPPSTNALDAMGGGVERSGAGGAVAPVAAPAQQSHKSLDASQARGASFEKVQDASEAASDGAVDPSLKYMQGSGAASKDVEELDLGGLSDEAEPELDLAARAAAWSPPAAAKRTTPGSSIRKPKSLVFASSGSSLVAGSAVSSTLRKSHTTPGFSSPAPQQDDGDGHVAGVAPLTLSKLAEFQGGLTGLASARRAATGVHAPAVDEAESEWASVPEAGPGSSQARAAVAAAAEATFQPPQRSRSSISEVVRASEDDDTSSEDGVEAPASSSPQHAALPTLEVDLELSPLVADSQEKFRKCFEKYVQRLHERHASGTVVKWDKLQERANQQIAGGHVGKLEYFWIHTKGAQPSPEAACGLVCFQFVQGHTSNFVRVLHLSVTGDSDIGEGGQASWCQLLPSAVREARRLIFSSMPADNMRAVVLAGEDDDGRIYVDSDLAGAYERCGFRWFQMTQNIRKSRSAFRATKIKLSSRFLVFSVHRGSDDPPRPAGGIAPLSALLLKSDAEATAAAAAAEAEAAGETVESFTAW